MNGCDQGGGDWFSRSVPSGRQIRGVHGESQAGNGARRSRRGARPHVHVRPARCKAPTWPDSKDGGRISAPATAGAVEHAGFGVFPERADGAESGSTRAGSPETAPSTVNSTPCTTHRSLDASRGVRNAAHIPAHFRCLLFLKACKAPPSPTRAMVLDPLYPAPAGSTKQWGSSRDVGTKVIGGSVKSRQLTIPQK
jgi:hypothetical protein